MHPNKKQAIVDKLNYIINHTISPSAYSAYPQPNVLLRIESGWVCLADEACNKYYSVCDIFANEDSWKDKLSREYIVTGVNTLLASIIKDGNHDNISVHLDAFITQCENVAEEHTVYLPLDNIEITSDHLDFGKFTLVNMRANQLEEQIRSFSAAISDKEGLEQLLSLWQYEALPLLSNKVVAVYTISAESRRTKELAEVEWYRFSDILRYFIFVFYEKKYSIDVGLRGDVRYGIGEAILIPSTYRTFQVAKSLKSPQSLLIGPQIEDAMRERGVFALADMLNPEQKTAFSDTLFTGIHWVANALIQSEPANEYLSLVTCLETFLTRERGDTGSIGNAVATGVAWIIGRDLADLLTIHKEVKKIYEKRSTISHGKYQEDIATYLPRLREIVSAVIIQMVLRRDEFRDSGKQGLFDWIDQGLLRPVSSPDHPQDDTKI